MCVCVYVCVPASVYICIRATLCWLPTHLNEDSFGPLARQAEGEDGARCVGHTDVLVGLVVPQSDHVVVHVAHRDPDVFERLKRGMQKGNAAHGVL